MKRGYLKAYLKTLLVILVIAMIICAVGYFLKNEYDDEQLKTIKTDMLLIEAKTKIIAEKVKIKEKGTTYIGKKIEAGEEIEEIKKLHNEGIINLENKKSDYYILEKQHLEELGLSTIKIEEGYYIVEYNSNEIIYTKGVQDKSGNRLYKLSDIEGQLIENEEKNSNVENKQNSTTNEPKKEDNKIKEK